MIYWAFQQTINIGLTVKYKKQFIQYIDDIDLSLENVLKETEPDFIKELRIEVSYKFLLGDKTLEDTKKGTKKLFLRHNVKQLDKVKNEFTFRLACKEMKKGLFDSFVQTIEHNFALQDEDTKQAFFSKYVEIK
jgi:hypothetical protein